MPPAAQGGLLGAGPPGLPAGTNMNASMPPAIGGQPRPMMPPGVPGPMGGSPTGAEGMPMIPPEMLQALIRSLIGGQGQQGGGMQFPQPTQPGMPPQIPPFPPGNVSYQ
jgi:hypothetical protein